MSLYICTEARDCDNMQYEMRHPVKLCHIVDMGRVVWRYEIAEVDLPCYEYRFMETDVMLKEVIQNEKQD